MGHVKPKSAFDHARIHIILHMRRVSSGHLLSIETFCNIQWLFADGESTDHTVQSDQGLRYSHIPEDKFLHGAAQII